MLVFGDKNPPGFVCFLHLKGNLPVPCIVERFVNHAERPAAELADNLKVFLVNRWIALVSVGVR